MIKIGVSHGVLFQSRTARKGAKMTVKDFEEFCCVRDIVLKDAYNGRVYTRIENYLDKEVIGFYPRFDLMRTNDGYNPMARIQIVAWISHDFERSKGE